jgi:hypothetical protein
MKTKGEVFNRFRELKTLIEIKALRSHNGGEYIAKYFEVLTSGTSTFSTVVVIVETETGETTFPSIFIQIQSQRQRSYQF